MCGVSHDFPAHVDTNIGNNYPFICIDITWLSRMIENISYQDDKVFVNLNFGSIIPMRITNHTIYEPDYT